MSSPPPTSTNRFLTDTEQELLDEYQRLLNNLYEMSDRISSLSDIAAGDLMESLRGLERKMGLVSTLLKTSVYRMVLMQELDGQEEEEHGNETMGEQDESRMIQ